MNPATIRKRLRAYIDVMQDDDLPLVLWVLQPFAARALNKQHLKQEEVKPDEAHQD